MRKLPSDDWRWSLSHARWRYYRWLSWVMSATGVLMGVWAVFMLLFALSVPPTDWTMVKILPAFMVGGAVVGLVGFRVNRWLGRREPPSDRTPG